MARESTDKEGGREVVGRSMSDAGAAAGMKHDLMKTSGRGGDFQPTKMDHKPSKSPFDGVGKGASTRRVHHQ